MPRRSTVLHLAFACLFAAACGGGSSTTPTPTPSGGGSPPPVGGVDAGTPVAGADAGTPGGGNGGPSRFAVTVAASGSGRITSTPAGIDCGTTCSASFDAGTHVSLAATPAAGWHLDGWGGACTGPGACDLTVGGDRTVYVTFVQDPPPPPPPANSCADIAAPADVSMRQYVQSPASGACEGAAGDSGGTLAFSSVYPPPAHGATLDFVSTAGTFLQHSGLLAPPSLLQQPDGVAAILGPSPYSGPPNAITLSRWDHAGTASGQGQRFGNRVSVWAAPNPGGGFLLAGDAAVSFSGPTQHSAAMFAGSPAAFTVLWTSPLASTGAVFGAGVDLRGRSLIITDGAAKFGAGAISGQWFDADGTSLTGEFLLVSSFKAGASTWFEATPLVGSGLLVRRVDSDHGLHSQALVVVASGAAQASAAPDWMVSRRDVQFQLARGNRAYATLPYGAPGVACSQRVEVLAADGTSCGTRDYPIAAGTCDTGDLGMGMDGTVIQPLPLSMETTLDTHGAHTCTWRWWASAVR